MKASTPKDRRLAAWTIFVVLALLLRVGGSALHGLECGIHVESHSCDGKTRLVLEPHTGESGEFSAHAGGCLLCQISHEPTLLVVREASEVSQAAPVAYLAPIFDRDSVASPRDLHASAPRAPPRF